MSVMKRPASGARVTAEGEHRTKKEDVATNRGPQERVMKRPAEGEKPEPVVVKRPASGARVMKAEGEHRTTSEDAATNLGPQVRVMKLPAKLERLEPVVMKRPASGVRVKKAEGEHRTKKEDAATNRGQQVQVMKRSTEGKRLEPVGIPKDGSVKFEKLRTLPVRVSSARPGAHIDVLPLNDSCWRQGLVEDTVKSMDNFQDWESQFLEAAGVQREVLLTTSLQSFRCKVRNDQRLSGGEMERTVVISSLRSVADFLDALQVAFFSREEPARTKGMCMTLRCLGGTVAFSDVGRSGGKVLVANPCKYFVGASFHCSDSGSALVYCGDKYVPMCLDIDVAPKSVRTQVDEMFKDVGIAEPDCTMSERRHQISQELLQRIPGVLCVL